MAFGKSIIGDKAVIKNLNSLAERVQRKILRKVLRRVGKPMVAEARKRVRRRSGTLAKSLGTVIRTYKKTSVVAIMGPRGGFRATWDGKEIDPVNYAHLIEKGHTLKTLGITDGAGGVLFVVGLRNPGHVQAFPFLGPAFEAHKGSARSSAIAEIAKEIEKEAERKAKVK